MFFCLPIGTERHSRPHWYLLPQMTLSHGSEQHTLAPSQKSQTQTVCLHIRVAQNCSTVLWTAFLRWKHHSNGKRAGLLTGQWNAPWATGTKTQAWFMSSSTTMYLDNILNHNHIFIWRKKKARIKVCLQNFLKIKRENAHKIFSAMCACDKQWNSSRHCHRQQQFLFTQPFPVLGSYRCRNVALTERRQKNLEGFGNWHNNI